MREGLPQFRVRPDFEVMRHPQEAVTVNPGKEPEPQRRDKPGAWSLSLVAIEAGAMRSTRLCWRSCNADPRSDACNAQSPLSNTARFRERRAEGQRCAELLLGRDGNRYSRNLRVLYFA
jgi:hypothetical protein